MDLIGDAYSSTHHRNLLCDLVDLDGRMAAQAGERKAACLAADASESNDVRNVAVTEFDVPDWWRDSSFLIVEVAEQGYLFSADH